MGDVKKKPLGPNPQVNVEQLTKDHNDWVAAGCPLTTPDNDPNPDPV